MGVHDGHRKRMLEKFHKYGFEVFQYHECLEMLLYFSVPRRDTNKIAHWLLDKYKNISGVINAPEGELAQLPYISDRTIELFKMIRSVSALCSMENIRKNPAYLCTTDEIATYFQLFFATEEEERFALLYLNNKGEFKNCEFVSRGDSASVGISTKKIIEFVLNNKANEVVLCHNHPGGIALPSAADIATTRNIKTALDNINVILKDHIIISEGDYVSLASCEEFKDIFKGV